MNIAVVGAGISGLSAAWWLRRAGHKILLFERHYKPGGRMNSRRKAGLVVDHGERYILRDSPVLRELILDCGLQGDFFSIDQPIFTRLPDGSFKETAEEAVDLNRATFRDGLLMLPEALRRQLGGFFSIAVTAVEADPDNPGQYIVRTDPPLRASEMRVDGIVFATPAPQAVDISRPIHSSLNPAFLERAAAVTYTRCFTLIAALEEVKLARAFYGLEVPESDKSNVWWIAFEDTKCQGRGFKGWTSLVVHASPAGSERLWRMHENDALERLYREAREIVPELPREWRWARAKRWEQAQVVNTDDLPDFDRYPAAKGEALVEFCGDYRIGNGVESAAQSGRRAAENLIRKSEPESDE
ncbi:FAD-dependent oxidoreductase [Candidatus Sumerlaeota bacterium]|nr:FAD-dependent oxidoreductase [Candidatus Sumerlaeota bacterium]